MNGSRPRYAGVHELGLEFENRRERIQQRLLEFAGVSPGEHFYEMVYCLLTPQSSAVNAARAVEALKKADLRGKEIAPAGILSSRSHYIRFHNMKAKHLTAAKMAFPEIAAKLANGSTGPEIRAWLVENVNGLGWKEASHFLRNIGYHELAILDRHILKNLKAHGVIGSLPKTLTAKRYLSIEKRFARFAQEIGISMDELDLLFWSRETGEILK